MSGCQQSQGSNVPNVLPRHRRARRSPCDGRAGTTKNLDRAALQTLPPAWLQLVGNGLEGGTAAHGVPVDSWAASTPNYGYWGSASVELILHYRLKVQDYHEKLCFIALRQLRS